MRAVVVYESMYGNTHEIAAIIGDRLAEAGDVQVVPLDDSTPELVADADLFVVGAPTHAHGMSRHATLEAAVAAAQKEDGPALDPDAPGPGVRAWFDGLPSGTGMAAAFDTRIDAPAFVTGRASKGVAHQLRKHGFHVVVDPESFLVTKHNELVAGEREHAQRWAGALLAATAPRDAVGA
jgi:hypothetical protein